MYSLLAFLLSCFQISAIFIFFHFLFCRLLDRDIVDAEEVAVDDEEENGFLKAFKVCFLFFFY